MLKDYKDRPYIPAKDPLSSIPPSRHPFQFWMMFALTMNGITNFIAAGSPAIEALVDPGFHKVWAATLTVAGILAILSAWWRDRVMGLLMERLALVVLALDCTVYGVAWMVQMGVESGGMGGTVVLSAGLASIWRAVHVNRELQVLRGFMIKTGMRGDE